MTELPRNDNEFLKANAIKHEEGRRSDREVGLQDHPRVSCTKLEMYA